MAGGGEGVVYLGVGVFKLGEEKEGGALKFLKGGNGC
jgi:hypothetical protein